jgi:RND family efflux transporter MFP subunit
LPLLLIAAGVWWAIQIRNAPPEARYTVAVTSDLVDILTTNGKAEPVEYAGVRAERAGILTKLFVEKGQMVSAGAPVAELGSAELRIAEEAAEARVAQIQAELAAMEKGGRPADLTDIENQLARLALDRQQLEKELATVRRLLAKNAATRQEAQTLEDRIAAIDQQRNALQARRSTLFTPADRSSLEARLREARSSVTLARERRAQGALRAPISGVAFQVDPRPGAFLNPGDLVANIGRIDELQIKVFIDEPELGRVAPGMPAVITWDAMAERRWEGTVEKMPAQIVTMGTRQVGEVLVRISNPNRMLPPGANINAAIRSRSAQQAVVVPKETLRRDSGTQGVYVLDGDRIQWRPVKTGISNVTHVQIVEGIKTGDRVLLASDIPLKSGQQVIPVKEDAGS